MNDFNYIKAYFVQVLPAWKKLSTKQLDAHSKVRVLISESYQDRNLNIPLTPAVTEILESLTNKELAELSRVSYFIGHYKPSNTEPMFSNTRGEAWKVSNCIDQILRKRFKLPHNIQIHDGKFRVTYSDKNCWIWEEFGLATDNNLKLFKDCGLLFNYENLEKSALKLKNIINDLWDNPDNEPDNQDYIEYMNVVDTIKNEKQLKLAREKLEEIKQEIEMKKNKYNGFKWLFDNHIKIDNCIYYEHTGIFTFGWGTPLKQIEKDQLKKVLINFPYKYELE